MAIIESAGNYAKIKQKLQNVEPTAAFRLVCVKQILKHCMALKTGALKFAPTGETACPNNSYAHVIRKGEHRVWKEERAWSYTWFWSWSWTGNHWATL